MPTFLREYLTNEIQKDFDFSLIDHLDVSPSVRSALKEEVLGLVYPINRQHPLLGNILRFFRHSGMLDSPCLQDALS
ncbi:aminobenzoate oxygenase, partial [Pseudomonas aeruginosa]|nr:aminobenzoate oxygenase [Pseudomonas aeruginosa]